MTMARTLRLFALEAAPQVPGIRAMERGDVPQVSALLTKYLERFELTPSLTEDEVEHWCVSPSWCNQEIGGPERAACTAKSV